MHKVSIIVILALLMGLAAPLAPASAGPKPPDYKPVDIGPEIREWDATQERIQGGPSAITPQQEEAQEAKAMAAAASTPYAD